MKFVDLFQISGSRSYPGGVLAGARKACRFRELNFGLGSGAGRGSDGGVVRGARVFFRRAGRVCDGCFFMAKSLKSGGMA